MGYKLRGKTFDEFEIGEEIIGGARTITEADVDAFARLSGDFQPEHMNEEYAKKGAFGQRIGHGLLTLSAAVGLINQTGVFEGTIIAVLEIQVHFLKAVKFGDTIRVIEKIVNKKESSKKDRGVITLKLTVYNQEDMPVLEADFIGLIYRRGFVPG